MKVALGRLRRVLKFATIAPAMTFSLACSAGVRTDDVVPAVWKTQQISFVYRGGASVHTCGGLRSQLRALLLALGAHEAVTIARVNCDDTASAHEVVIVIASPFEASKNLDPPVIPDAKEILLARVRGESPVATSATFPARWKTISFANAMRLRLSPADCELLKQLQRDVMPRLSVRVLRDRMRCQSGLGSGFRPQLGTCS
jgi:hypothetical protein